MSRRSALHGGGTLVWPLIQDYDYLSLDPIQIEITLKAALSIENMRVNVPSVFTVAVGIDPATMKPDLTDDGSHGPSARPTGHAFEMVCFAFRPVRTDPRAFA